MFEVCEPSGYCKPQMCYAASLWYGDVLMSFYSVDESRLEIANLNKEAEAVLWAITRDLNGDATELIKPEPLWRLVGNAGCLCCYWADWNPPVSICGSSVCIPLNKEA